MNLTDLYAQTPVERHQEIVVSGGRLYFEDEEYVIQGDGELKLVHSQKELEQRLARIETKLGVK